VNALPERREAIITEAFCKECESATPIIVTENIITVELTCDVCLADIRYTLPRYGLDYCVECGIKILDGQKNGFESPTGQRGHLSCQQRANARVNRTTASFRFAEGDQADGQRWMQLAYEAEQAANRMEAES